MIQKQGIYFNYSATRFVSAINERQDQ